jgi:hypothetical protein
MLQRINAYYVFQFTGLTFNEDDVGEASSCLTSNQIDVACIFIDETSKKPEFAKKVIYESEVGNTLTTERLRVVLTRDWLTDDVSFYFILTL